MKWFWIPGLVVAGLIYFRSGDRATAQPDIVTLRYGDTIVSVSQTAFQRFVHQGDRPDDLAKFFDAVPLEADEVRDRLMIALPLSPSFIERNFDSQTAEFVLLQLDKLIGVNPRQGTIEPLREALLTSYRDDLQISLAEIIEDYPRSSVQVDLSSLEAVYRDISLFIDRIQPLLEIATALLPELVCECDLPVFESDKVQLSPDSSRLSQPTMHLDAEIKPQQLDWLISLSTPDWLNRLLETPEVLE